MRISDWSSDVCSSDLGARHDALQDRTLIDVDLLDAQLVDVSAVIVLGVGDRGLQHLKQDAGRLARGVLEAVARIVDGFAANEISTGPRLFGRLSSKISDGLSLQDRQGGF